MPEWALVPRTLSFQGTRESFAFADSISGLKLLTARHVRLVRILFKKMVDV
jgi:hypothetical protein